MTAALAKQKAIGGRVKFTYMLPRTKVKGVRYVTNHHYVELEDHAERKLHLPASGLMRHECKACRYKWWTESNQSSFCPGCGSSDVQKMWGRLQLAFVPEKEEDFTPVEALLHEETNTGDLTEEVIDDVIAEVEDKEALDDAFDTGDMED